MTQNPDGFIGVFAVKKGQEIGAKPLDASGSGQGMERRVLGDRAFNFFSRYKALAYSPCPPFRGPKAGMAVKSR